MPTCPLCAGCRMGIVLALNLRCAHKSPGASSSGRSRAAIIKASWSFASRLSPWRLLEGKANYLGLGKLGFEI